MVRWMQLRPVGIGNLAAKTIIEYRYADGSNQQGHMPGANGKPYSDYTGISSGQQCRYFEGFKTLAA
jgi:hypothetical protein